MNFPFQITSTSPWRDHPGGWRQHDGSGQGRPGHLHEAVPQGFDWNLQFNWHAVPDHEKNKHSHRACGLHTMAGGMFSVDKAFSDRHLQWGQSGDCPLLPRGPHLQVRRQNSWPLTLVTTQIWVTSNQSKFSCYMLPWKNPFLYVLVLKGVSHI